jgi:hypothetical protein
LDPTSQDAAERKLGERGVTYLLIPLWLITGVVSFFLMRWLDARVDHEPRCKPITIGTLTWCFLLMWFPPLTMIACILFAIAVTLHWIGEWPIWEKEVINPCRWFAK